MRYETEVDINMMAQDAAALENEVERFRSEFEKLIASVDELNRSWQGPAKKEFDAQVKLEEQECRDSIADLREVIDGLTKAKNEYSKCESTVGTLVNRIRI